MGSSLLSTTEYNDAGNVTEGAKLTAGYEFVFATGAESGEASGTAAPPAA